MTEHTTPPREAALFASIRGWGVTRGNDGILSGVASGVGAKIGLAPLPARAILVLAGIIMFPVVMIAYAAAWGLLPDAQGNIVFQNFGRGVTNVGALIGIGLLTLIGIGSFGSFPGLGGAFISARSPMDSFDLGSVVAIMFAILIPLGFIALVVGLIVWLVRRSNRPSSPVGEQVYALTPEQARAAAAQAYPQAASTAVPGAPVPPPAVAFAPAPPPQTFASVPRVPRVPGPGRGFYLLTAAWAVASMAAVAWAKREDMLTTWTPVAWGLLFLTGLGVILMLVSFSGRRVGFLGALGVIGIIPGVILAANHSYFTADYEAGTSPIQVSVDETYVDWVDDSDVAYEDFTMRFDGDYSEIYLGGFCWEQDFHPAPDAAPVARATVSTDDGSTTYLARGMVNYVTVDPGTSLTVSSDPEQLIVVWFPDAAIACDASGDLAIELVNPDTPVANIVVPPGMDYPTVVIQEN